MQNYLILLRFLLQQVRGEPTKSFRMNKIFIIQY